MSLRQSTTGDPCGLQPILHADDCGLSVGITDAIVACYDRGWLHRTSVVTNGAGWEDAVAALRRRPRLSVSLHLNFFEGHPLSPPHDVDLLVNSHGRFQRGFVGLWVHGLLGARATRLRAQIRLELRRQIERFLLAFGDRGPLSIDGHVHYHVLPPVFRELLALSAEYPIGAIRLPREPLYWPLTRGAPRPPMVNVLKNVVLRMLCRRIAPVIHERSLETSDAFVGVLGTGAMTLAHVRAAMECLRRAGISGKVEILFHPGRGRPNEASLWSDRPELQAFYLSPDRDREADLLRSTALGHLLRPYGLVWAGDGARRVPSDEGLH
jgi:chitin disaccharide deacetylase